jgi:hypothetical protein
MNYRDEPTEQGLWTNDVNKWPIPRCKNTNIINSTWWKVGIVRLFITSFFPAPCWFFYLMFKHSCKWSILISDTLHRCSRVNIIIMKTSTIGGETETTGKLCLRLQGSLLLPRVWVAPSTRASPPSSWTASCYLENAFQHSWEKVDFYNRFLLCDHNDVWRLTFLHGKASFFPLSLLNVEAANCCIYFFIVAGSVGIVTSPWAPAIGNMLFSFLRHPHWLCGPHNLSSNVQSEMFSEVKRSTREAHRNPAVIYIILVPWICLGTL